MIPKTHSSNELINSSPLRDTKRRIFDDSIVNNGSSQILKDEIDEIITHRKTKNGPLNKDLYESFGRESKKSARFNSNSNLDHFPGEKSRVHTNNENFKSMYSEFYNEKKGVTGCFFS